MPKEFVMISHKSIYAFQVYCAAAGTIHNKSINKHTKWKSACKQIKREATIFVIRDIE